LSKEYLISILDEQNSVGFTGRVNVLNQTTKQLLGEVIFNEGQIMQARYKGVIGLKAFYNLCIDEFENVALGYIVEPELIDATNTQIPYPYSVLKRKIVDVIENFKQSKSQRPPDNLKILIKPEFLAQGEVVTGAEFDLLCTLSDYNLVEQVYKNCKLLDYEITNALVSLRKKNALTVVMKK
jgi:hypothetical protein